MAKFVQASEDLQEIVDNITNELDLTNFLDFETIHCPKAKEVVSVSKASATAEYLSKREDLILVIIREDAFDRLGNDEQAQKNKYMWLRKELEKISYDTERERVVIDNDAQITVPIPFYDRYKSEAIDSALLAKYTLAQIEDEEKERREQEKQAKRGKKKEK